MTPAPITDGATRGAIIPIGGAEEKIGDTTVLRRFVALAGGEKARIAIIPTASQLDDTGERYEALFTSGDALRRYKPYFDRLRAMKPYQLSDELEQFLHDTSGVGAAGCAAGSGAAD